MSRRGRGPGIVGRASAALIVAAGVLALHPTVAPGQATGSVPVPSHDVHPAVGREAAEALRFPDLTFTPPEATEHEVHGVEVFHLHDPTLPLVEFFVRVRGGYGLYGREVYAAYSSLSSLMRSGGTRFLPPDSVDARMESLALQTSFGSGGGGQSSSLNTLRATMDEALELWTEMLLHPRFDSVQVEVWRGQELESVRRRSDDPGRLAYSEFNRLLFGDHPVGWELDEEDLDAERFNRDVMLASHARIFCRENLMLGVGGDLTWEEASATLTSFVERWPPCLEEVPEGPEPEILEEPGVWLIPLSVPQSTVVLAHPVPLRQEDSGRYVSSRIANQILGGGGFSSRLMSRVRAEQGYAYSVSSLWTAPERYDGLVGATVQTGSGTTVAAIRSILEVMEEMRSAPPLEEEVSDAIDALVNGYAFNFDSPAQVVLRRMAFRVSELPDDWLTRYVERVQAVTPGDVHAVMQEFVHPARMSILIVGDPEAFDLPPETLGPVRILEVGTGSPPAP